MGKIRARAMRRALATFVLLVLGVLPATGRGSAPVASEMLSPNYAHAPEMEGLYSWRQFPLRVFFARDAAGTPNRERAARDGFDAWTRATNSVLSYKVVDTPRQADVTVRFLDDDVVPGSRNMVGRTETLVRGGRALVRARIVLAVGDMEPDEVAEVAAHEWGHALGINGHSDRPDDLMYGVGTRFFRADGSRLPRPSRSVTERDRNTLKLAYPALFRGDGR